MGLFLGKDAGDETVRWSEAQIQMFIVQEGRRSGYLVIGGTEQGVRSKSAGGKLKATGMVAGHVDMTWVLPMGKVIWIELKTADGVVSNVQKEHHEKLKELGHCVEVVFAKSPMDGWNKVRGILEG